MALNECPIGKTYLALGSEPDNRAFTASDVQLVTGAYSIVSDRLFMNSSGSTDSVRLYNDNNSTNQFSLDVGDTISISYITSESTGFTNAAKVQFGDIEAGFEASLGGLIFAKTDGASRQYGTQTFANGQQLDISVTITKQAGDNAEISITCVGNEGSDTVSISGAMGTDRSILITKETNIAYISVKEAYIIGNDLESTCIGNKYTIVTPRYPLMGYTTQIAMQWKTNIIANNEVKVFDFGVEHDQYTCNYEYTRETTEAEELATLAEITSRGQGVNVDTITGSTNTEFLPFAPHVSNVNPSVYITDFRNNGQVNPFGVIHNFALEIVPNETLTFNTQESICVGGGFRFGSLANTELPEMEYVAEEYKVNNNRYGSNSNLNWNPSTAKHRYCRLRWKGSLINAKNILIEILQNIRALPFTMNAGANYYPFGVDIGQGDKTVRISNPIINVTAIEADTWEVLTEVIYVSG